MILPWPWGDHFGKRTALSLIYFLNYAYLEIWPSALFFSSPFTLNAFSRLNLKSDYIFQQMGKNYCICYYFKQSLANQKNCFLWMKQVEFNMDFMVHTMYYITYHVVLHTEFTLRQFVALL